MNKNELISVPNTFKPAVELPQKIPAQAPIEMPEDIKVVPEALRETISVDIIEQAPFSVEVFQLPHLKMGQKVVEGLITVPGAESAEAVESGVAVAGQAREVVNLGGLDDFKGGNPDNVIGFDGIVRK